MVIEQWQGLEDGGEAASTRVLRSTEEWQAFWGAVAQPVPRPLDPSRELAVVIGLGQRRTAGYRAEVVRSQLINDAWIIEYREHRPDPGMRVAQMITEPWVVAIIPRTERPVTIKRLEEPSPRPSER